MAEVTGNMFINLSLSSSNSLVSRCNFIAVFLLNCHSARPDQVTLDRQAKWISVTWRYVIAEDPDRLPDSS
ncbi:hypothetical protein HZ326_22885 [Fusarium oxysporum f. sp. albedinis]|nr:hypothetical protein HZ326_22885 [Fusarium oxysporum f. sp. albedinis]